MRLRRCFGFVLSGLLVITVLSSASNAQLRKRQPLLRWMGQGFGDGYHQCNPGPVSDYYNPYSAHNSLLQSSTYPYQDPYSDRLPPGARYDLGAPGADNSALIYNARQGEVNQGSFHLSPFRVQNEPELRSLDRLKTGWHQQVAIPNDLRGPLGNSAASIDNDSRGMVSQRGLPQAGFRSKANQPSRSTNRFAPFRNQN